MPNESSSTSVSDSRTILAWPLDHVPKELVSALQQAGYDVLPVRTKQEAQDLLRNEGSLPALVSGEQLGKLLQDCTPQQAPRTAAPAEGCVQQLQGVRVLVVDDSDIVRMVVRRYCEQLGCKDVHEVRGGSEALEHLASGAPCDLVVMDVEMPRMGGIETVRRLRGGEAGKEAALLPVIAMTSHDVQGSRESCLEAGMDWYLAKPLSLAALGQALEQLAPRLPEKEKAPCPPPDQGAFGPLLDVQAAVERMGGDVRIFEEMKRMFAQERPSLVQALQDAETRGDQVGQIRAVHRLKNLYRTVGAESCGACCARLETALKRRDTAQAAGLLPLLLQEDAMLLELLGP